MKDTRHEQRIEGRRRPSILHLHREFYERSTVVVARDLLGKFLVHEMAGERRAGMIVETEAYVGPHDQACHAFKGRTERTEVMFGPAGHLYVYFIYGMYYCLNIVTEQAGFPAAVLIRALQPVERGSAFNFEETERSLRPNGPGKLCRFMQIDKTHYGLDLCGGPIWVEDRGVSVSSGGIIKAPRVGVDYAGAWKDRPFRFYLKNNRWVSRP